MGPPLGRAAVSCDSRRLLRVERFSGGLVHGSMYVCGGASGYAPLCCSRCTWCMPPEHSSVCRALPPSAPLGLTQGALSGGPRPGSVLDAVLIPLMSVT